MKNPILTILTPTYNRKHLLGRLHASLVAQDVPPDSFEWLIVDDGSTDGTADYIKQLKPISNFSIRILTQENSGKCAALNVGFSAALGEWVSIVDSDDYLLDDGIQNVIKMINSVTSEDVAVIFCLHSDDSGDSKVFDQPDTMEYFYQWANTGNLFDTSQVFRVSAVKKYAFPLAKGETFMAESWIFHVLDQNYKSVFRNIKILQIEYQVDGLSRRADFLRTINPLNALNVYRAQVNSSMRLRLVWRGAVNYWRYYFHARRLGKKEAVGLELKYFPFIFIGLALFSKDLVTLKEK